LYFGDISEKISIFWSFFGL